MRVVDRSLIVSLFVLIAAPAMLSAQSADIDKIKTLTTARERYYNLRTLGLSEVKAAIQPNWDVLLEGTNAAPSAKTTLNSLHFWISIDAADQMRLSHDAKAIPANQVEGVEKIFKGINESVSGFFSTWSIFLLTSPFPAPGSDYTVARLPNGFRFSQKQGEFDVTIDTDNEFAITEIRVVSVNRISSLKPTLEKTSAGLVLKGYAASSRGSDGAETTVQASLEYEMVSGLQLLHKVKVDAVYQGAPAKLEWAFADYQVKMR